MLHTSNFINYVLQSPTLGGIGWEEDCVFQITATVFLICVP